MTATSVWPTSFGSAAQAEAALLGILMKSSRKPDEPEPGHEEQHEDARRPSAGRRRDEVGDRVAASARQMMTAPPMVGVPRLVWCDVGPSSRMNWP